MRQVVQITAPHFCCGIVMMGDTCVQAAPIMGWARGKSRGFLRSYFASKGWKAVVAKTR